MFEEFAIEVRLNIIRIYINSHEFFFVLFCGFGFLWLWETFLFLFVDYSHWRTFFLNYLTPVLKLWIENTRGGTRFDFLYFWFFFLSLGKFYIFFSTSIVLASPTSLFLNCWTPSLTIKPKSTTIINQSICLWLKEYSKFHNTTLTHNRDGNTIASWSWTWSWLYNCWWEANVKKVMNVEKITGV